MNNSTTKSIENWSFNKSFKKINKNENWGRVIFLTFIKTLRQILITRN